WSATSGAFRASSSSSPMPAKASRRSRCCSTTGARPMTPRATCRLRSMPSPPQYFKFDTSKVPVLLVTLTSGSLPPDQLYDLTDTLLKPAVAQVDGVAQVQVGGGTPHAVRIALNANALAIKGITTNDVANALRAANVTSPQGILSNGHTQMTVTANDSLHTPADFASLVIASRQGVPVRLADVATI